MRSVVTLLAVTTATLLASCVTSDECEDGACLDEGALYEQAYEEGQQPGKEDGSDCSGVRVPDRGGFDKRIALTFDDGPNPATTPKVIEILHRHHAPATFFNNGVRYATAGAKELAAQIAADPDFILANHSQHHLDLAHESEAKVTSEIDATEALIREAGETPRYFRFPFGSATCRYKKMVEDRGYVVTGWHIDSADWCYAAGNGVCKKSTFKFVPDELRDDMKAYVLSQARSTGGGVILFHDIHASTANHLDDILTALEAEGFSFVRLDDTSVFPRLHGQTPPPAKFIGDACATDADCGFTANGQLGLCHPAGFCTISCTGTCPDLSGKAPTFCIENALAPGSGLCVSKAAAQNQSCALLPGTEDRIEDRFLGDSSAPPATASVCAPR